MNKKSNKIIVFDYIIERDHTEIDMDLLEKQFPGYSDDDMKNYPQIVRKGNHKMSWSGECEAIEIAHIEKFITDCKAKGCTHVEIMHHSDHNGYYFYGIKVFNADKKLVKELNEELNKTREKLLKKKKQELENELKLINDQLDNKKS